MNDLYDNLNYEDCLFRQFYDDLSPNTCDTSLLFIADTHGDIAFNPHLLDGLKPFDLCILLGDHLEEELKIILNRFKDQRICGVLGNHDLKDQYQKLGIKDLHQNTINVNGLKIAGLGGSFKYKDSEHYPLLTHDQSIQIAKTLPADINILISHDKPFLKDSFDSAHDGLKGITYAIYKNRIPLHFHGHLHKNCQTKLKNGCISRCITGIEKVCVRFCSIPT